MKKFIQSKTDKYRQKYGLVPRFKVALHYGEIIRGEVGDLKCEIAFHGDVINTTARMERLCSKLKEEILISDPLYQLFPGEVKKLKFKGNFHLKGKKNKMPLYGMANELPYGFEN